MWVVYFRRWTIREPRLDTTFFFSSIRVKKAPKPVPVKPRPPNRPLLHFTEPATLLVYIFVTTTLSHNMLTYFQLRPTVDVRHAALSPLPQPLRLPPERAHFPSFPVARLLGSLRLSGYTPRRTS
jgi:hypothetical protein